MISTLVTDIEAPEGGDVSLIKWSVCVYAETDACVFASLFPDWDDQDIGDDDDDDVDEEDEEIVDGDEDDNVDEEDADGKDGC
jgi:hypothetical protein